MKTRPPTKLERFFGDVSGKTVEDQARGDGLAVPIVSPADLKITVPRATAPRIVPDDSDAGHPALFFNRELSWLDFNWRVLHQALDERNPLLERVRFLSIAASNLDEFFRKRVGGLKRQEAAGVEGLSTDGRTPTEQLALIRQAAVVMHEGLLNAWEEVLRPQLAAEAGIHIVDVADVSVEDRVTLHEYFQLKIYPILTPLAVDPGHPFPFISNLSLSLAVTVHHPARDTEHFARLKVPISRGRWVPLTRPNHFVPVEQVIMHHSMDLFRGMDVMSVHPFRITRNADVSRNEEEAEDLLEMISGEVRERRFAPVVRMEIDAQMPRRVRDLLMRELRLGAGDLYEVGGLMELRDIASLLDIADPPRSDLKYPAWSPVTPARLVHEGESGHAENIFEEIRRGDVLLHHPYESFTGSVQRFVEEAAADGKVIAIKQTLYRTSDDSPIVRALTRAAENGKQVAVLVEVKARFDEESNIGWGQTLEKAGAHVTYGLVGLKTHCKVTLVIREEADGLRAYVHLGTGNYHPQTARLYTDVGFLTCEPDIGADVINLFHYLTGYAPEQAYRKLIVAPRGLRKAFMERIRREAAVARGGGRGRIIAKMNALDDDGIIRELYEASGAGVEIDLIVRGHCRLRPGLPGFSENIRVISIIGRFLEHSRIYCFGNDGDPAIYIGSADWQRRNLDDRVEIIAPVEEPDLKRRLIHLLRMAIEDNRLAWELHSDGHYVQRFPSDGSPELSFHDRLMQAATQRNREADPPWDL